MGWLGMQILLLDAFTLGLHAIHGQRLWAIRHKYLRIFYEKKNKDVSREFDEFQVNTRLCKLRCWYL